MNYGANGRPSVQKPAMKVFRRDTANVRTSVTVLVNRLNFMIFGRVTQILVVRSL